jgi:hypothetical protein
MTILDDQATRRDVGRRALRQSERAEGADRAEQGRALLQEIRALHDDDLVRLPGSILDRIDEQIGETT